MLVWPDFFVIDISDSFRIVHKFAQVVHVPETSRQVLTSMCHNSKEFLAELALSNMSIEISLLAFIRIIIPFYYI